VDYQVIKMVSGPYVSDTNSFRYWFLKPQAARLETRRNFFSNRVVEAWKMVPGVKTVSSFKNAYRRHREENA
jgi:hypothetical protein